MKTAYLNRFMLIFTCACMFLTSQSQSKKSWTIKTATNAPAYVKKVLDGKQVKQGENKIPITSNIYANILVDNGAIKNTIFTTNGSGITISIDASVARRSQTRTTKDICASELKLCNIQCDLGAMPDPMYSGTCKDQCKMAHDVCPYVIGFRDIGKGLSLQ